jgi:hypothetical protein
MEEILKEKKAPGVKSNWPTEGRYVSGLAEYSGDPNAFCLTREDAEEKRKRQGKVLIADE